MAVASAFSSHACCHHVQPRLSSGLKSASPSTATMQLYSTPPPCTPHHQRASSSQLFPSASRSAHTCHSLPRHAQHSTATSLHHSSLQAAPCPAAKKHHIGGPQQRGSALHAKKGGSGSKKGGPKGGKSSPLAGLLKEKEKAAQQEAEGHQAGPPAPATPEQHSSPEMLMYLMVLTQGYWQQAKEYLLEGADFSQLGSQLFSAPFAVLAQDKYSEPQAIAYCNHAMLDLLGGTWDQVVGRDTAAFCAQPDRAEQDVFFSGSLASGSRRRYEGQFLSLSGKKFTVKGGILFDIHGPGDEKIGQGLKFSEVLLEDGSTLHLDPAVAAAAAAKAAEESALPPTLAQAEAWVKEQGDVVRALKADKGLTNQDEEVQQAVQELLRRKEWLEKLTKQQQQQQQQQHSTVESSAL